MKGKKSSQYLRGARGWCNNDNSNKIDRVINKSRVEKPINFKLHFSFFLFQCVYTYSIVKLVKNIYKKTPPIHIELIVANEIKHKTSRREREKKLNKYRGLVFDF
jgi:hypothetical protein